MSVLKHGESDPGPTGRWSPPKIWGLVLSFAGIAPLVLWFLEIGPEMGAWTAFGISIGCMTFGLVLYYGFGRGLAKQASDALLSRVQDDS